MLTDEQKAVLHYAIDNGFHAIEYKCFANDVWICGSDVPFNMMLSNNATLRIKQTPDSIDWSHVSTDIYCMARDECGDCYGYTVLVEACIRMWRTSIRFDCVNMTRFASYKRGTVDWKESLVLNPYYKDKK